MTPPPDIWCCRAIELAVRVLPAEHRQRYGLEFVAELYGMPPAQQRRHSARMLTSAWTLRTALSETVPLADGEQTVITKTHKPLACRLNLHHRWRSLSTEDGDRYDRCEKCGKDYFEHHGGGPRVICIG
jgi:hypothetical protein